MSARSGSVAIPDNRLSGASSSVNVALPGVVKDLDVRIGQITHPFVGDLRIELRGPDGTTVTLAEHPGGPDNSGNNFTGTVFDDEATPNIAAGAAPYTGRFKPQNDQLSRFDGKPRQGVWTLRVRDLASPDSGTLGSWQTEMARAACNGGPSTSIGARPGNPSASRSATFGLGKTGGDPGGGFECRLDGGAFAECASGKTYAGLADGVHTFRARAVDGSGNVDATPAPYTWRVDAAPETAITSGPAGGGNGSSAQFASAPRIRRQASSAGSTGWRSRAAARRGPTRASARERTPSRSGPAIGQGTWTQPPPGARGPWLRCRRSRTPAPARRPTPARPASPWQRPSTISPMRSPVASPSWLAARPPAA